MSYSIISASPGNNCVYQVRVRQDNKNETSKIITLLLLKIVWLRYKQMRLLNKQISYNRGFKKKRRRGSENKRKK